MLQFFWYNKKEDKSDTELQNMAVHSLERYFGKENVPKPIGFFTTRFNGDPLARGSFSAHGTYSTNDDFQELAAPESFGLHFAGEHTDYHGRYQTMDGAYNTGIREAERIATRPWNTNMVGQHSEWSNPHVLEKSAPQSSSYSKPLAQTLRLDRNYTMPQRIVPSTDASSFRDHGISRWLVGARHGVIQICAGTNPSGWLLASAKNCLYREVQSEKWSYSV
jgi:hypothetical protein